MRNTAAAPLLLALVVLVGAAGCSDDSAGDADPTVASDPATSSAPTTGAPTATSTAIPEASAPPFTTDTLPNDGGAGWGRRG